LYLVYVCMCAQVWLCERVYGCVYILIDCKRMFLPEYMEVWLYICMCVCVYIYIYIYICVHKCTFIYIYIYIYIYTHTHTYVRGLKDSLYIHTYTGWKLYSSVYMRIYTVMYTYILMSVYISIYAALVNWFICIVCMYACVNMHVHI
jgi:hypothetical protein